MRIIIGITKYQVTMATNSEVLANLHERKSVVGYRMRQQSFVSKYRVYSASSDNILIWINEVYHTIYKGHSLRSTAMRGISGRWR